jgi:hypothetical protein
VNYLPELREAMVDAARRHYQLDPATRPTPRCTPSRFRRVPGGRSLALVGVLVLGGASGAIAAAARLVHRVPVSEAALAAPKPTSGTKRVPSPQPITARATPVGGHKTVAAPQPATGHRTTATPEPITPGAKPIAGHKTVAAPKPATGRKTTASPEPITPSAKPITATKPVPRAKSITDTKPVSAAPVASVAV